MTEHVIVIPAYNEKGNLDDIVHALIKINQTCIDENIISGLRILFIDDHSSDGSYQDILRIKSENKDKIKIDCIRLSKNSGSTTATRVGFLHSEHAQSAAVLAADGQTNPQALIDMYRKWKDGAHVVWALRKERKEPIRIKFFAMLFYKILDLLHLTVPSVDMTRADFFLLDQKVVHAVNANQERDTSIFGLITWVGFNQQTVEYDRPERKRGSSKWSFKSRFTAGIDWIVAFSGLPLKLMAPTGLFVALVGFGYACIVIINSLFGHPVEGWSSIIVITLVLGGLQMIMFGIVGEYLWHNLAESRKRPLYFVEETTLVDV